MSDFDDDRSGCMTALIVLGIIAVAVWVFGPCGEMEWSGRSESLPGWGHAVDRVVARSQRNDFDHVVG